MDLYLSESEGANYWLSVLTDLHNRGVKDILIACIDGLTGFPDAIATIYPETEIHLCIIHQIRNSMSLKQNGEAGIRLSCSHGDENGKT